MRGATNLDVLVVSPTFAPEPLGTPQYATDLAVWLQQRGVGVRVVTAQPFYPSFERYPGYGRGRRRDQVCGLPVYRLPTVVPHEGRAPYRALNEANFAFQGWAARVRRKIPRAPVVISVSPGTPAIVALARLLTAPGGRHLSIVHDVQSGLAAQLGMVPPRLIPLMRRFERWALSQADVLHVLTEEMREAVEDLGVRTPTRVSPIWATVQRPRSPAPGPLVQYSGNLGHKQGADQLVALAQALRELLPDEKLLIRGAGSMLQVVTDLPRCRGLDNVVLAPLANEADLPAALAASAIHVVPQQPGCAGYTMPSKIVNALAVGGIVVAGSSRPSALWRLSEQTETLRCVDAGDTGAMARAVAELARDRERLARLSDAAAGFAAANFDRDTILGEMLGSVASTGGGASSASGLR